MSGKACLTTRYLVATVCGALLSMACTSPAVGQGDPVTAPPHADDVQLLHVAPERAPCVGVAPMQCLQVRA